MFYYLFFTEHMQFGVLIQMSVRNVTDSLKNPEKSLGKENKKVDFTVRCDFFPLLYFFLMVCLINGMDF